MRNKNRAKTNHTLCVFPCHVGSHVLCKSWYHLLQKLSGRSVSPGLQMFGQSVSGNVDMDDNGYAGKLRPEERIFLPSSGKRGLRHATGKDGTGVLTLVLLQQQGKDS